MKMPIQPSARTLKVIFNKTIPENASYLSMTPKDPTISGTSQSSISRQQRVIPIMDGRLNLGTGREFTFASTAIWWSERIDFDADRKK